MNFNEVEQLYSDKYAGIMKADSACNKWHGFIKAVVKENAYHEAGHFAAIAFAYPRHTRTLLISILPDVDFDGNAFMGRIITKETPEDDLRFLQDDEKQLFGKVLILTALSGEAAVIKKSDSPLNCHDVLEIQTGQNIPDIDRAKQIAATITESASDAGGLLKMLCSWTDDLLTRPDIWKTVERVAAMLMEFGEIEDDALLYELTESIAWFMEDDIWRQRLGAGNVGL